jgi:hypothetical protein
MMGKHEEEIFSEVLKLGIFAQRPIKENKE